MYTYLCIFFLCFKGTIACFRFLEINYNLKMFYPAPNLNFNNFFYIYFTHIVIF